VAENNDPSQTLLVGNLRAVDPDSSDTHSFALVEGDGAADNGLFQIRANQLELQAGITLDRESKSLYSVRIAATDSGGDSFEKAFEITVINVNESPTDITINNVDVQENISGAVIGELAAADPDADLSHTFTTDDSRFEIVGQILKLTEDQFLSFGQGVSVDVNIVATDSGSPAHSFQKTIVLAVVANPFPWQNPTRAFDANRDGSITPLDALVLINQLNDPTILAANGRLPTARPENSSLNFFDPSGDGFCTSNDVLRIVNFLNNQLGEAEQSSRLLLPALFAGIDDSDELGFLLAVVAEDVHRQWRMEN
jgi:hypothetical protein